MKPKSKMAMAQYRAAKRARDRAAIENWLAQVLDVLRPHGVSAVRVHDISVGSAAANARWHGLR